MISYISFLLVVLGDQMLEGFSHFFPSSKTKTGFFTPCFNQSFNNSLAAFLLSLPGKLTGYRMYFTEVLELEDQTSKAICLI